MGFWSSLADAKLPTKVYDSVESLMKALFGEAVKETGEIIADRVRIYRFNNQLNTFIKTQQKLESKGLIANKISLKLLTPMIENISVEDDNNIQEIWANLIANVSQNDGDDNISLKCINILKELSFNEIKMLNYLYEKFSTKEALYLIQQSNKGQTTNFMYPDNFEYPLWKDRDVFDLSAEKMQLHEDRLLSFGLIKNILPDLIQTSNNVYDLDYNSNICFTSFGLYFVRLCKFD